MSERIDKIVEDIKGLSLLEASELVKKLEEVLGVSAAAAAPVMVAAAGAAAGRRSTCRGTDRILSHPHGGGREQDQRHQGCP